MAKKKDIKLVIPSSLDQIEIVEKTAEKVVDKMNFTEEAKDSVAIAVTEAVNNAILHGNKQDKNKMVTVTFQLEEKRLVVRIKDEGPGFNPKQLSDPLAPENLLKESGRGIFILSSLMDEVEFDFDEKGTEIILIKNKS